MKGVDVLIRKNKAVLNDLFWNRYDLILWKPDPGGYTNEKGLFHKNKWGISSTVKINSSGNWELPSRYVKNFK